MWRRVIGAAAVLMLAACEKEEGKVETPCVMPTYAATAAEGTWPGMRERATICVKRRAFEMTRAGGPLPPIAAAAVAACAAEEKAALDTLAKTGPVYDYQRKQVHDGLLHAAQLSATQARSIGCGRKPGERPDTL